MLHLVVTFGSVMHETPNCNKGKEDCSSLGFQKLIVEHGKEVGRTLPGTRARHEDSQQPCAGSGKDRSLQWRLI